MSAFVLDCSVTMTWAFREEFTPFALGLLESLPDGQAAVPAIWPVEVANVLMVAERGEPLTQADTSRFVGLLQALPIVVDVRPEQRVFDDVLPVARETGLSVYDASYLELAMRLGLPLATLDARLKAAADVVGVQVMR